MSHFARLMWCAVVICGLGIREVKAAADIVRDGQAQAEIIVAADALSSVKVAAQDLQKHVALISGATLRIVAAPTETAKTHIYVGNSSYLKLLGVTVDDLPPEGFRIVVRGDFIALVGRDEQREPFRFDRRAPNGTQQWQEFAGQASVPLGVSTGVLNRELRFRTMDATATLYAVSAFLEQLGVRWYGPYEDGTVVPERKTITIVDQNLTCSPKFPYREFNYYNSMSLDTPGVLWFKRLKFGSSHVYCNDAHSTRNILGTDEMRTTHPSYYAKDAQGKAIAGHNGSVPKLSDEGFQKESTVFMNKTVEAYPSLQTITLGMPDGFTVVDADDASTWLKPGASPDSPFSDYVWNYWLKMAAELKVSHPDKYLNCYSYTTYAAPPSQVAKLPDNVALTMTYGCAFSMLPLYTESLSPMREKWLSMLPSKKFFIWEYCLFYRKNAPTVPVVFNALLQKEMQRLSGNCEGKFIEIMPSEGEGSGKRIAFPALTHMIHYVQGKLYWDPDLDLPAMLEEYYTLYFGPARVEMQAFYEFAETVWTRPQSRSITPTTGFLTEKDVARYFELLAQAKVRVEKGSIYERRISRLESEMNPLRSFFTRLKRTGPPLVGKVLPLPADRHGDLKLPFWEGDWFEMKDSITGKALPDQLRTRVAFRLSADRKLLLIGVVCGEPNGNKRVCAGTKNDEPAILDDDGIEIYLETPERSYFKIAVNAAGFVYDESHDNSIVERDTMPRLWDPGIKAALNRVQQGWSAEIAIPTADLGNVTLGPQKLHPWGVNVARRYRSEEERGYFALSPTGEKEFGVLSKLGTLTMPK